MKKYVYAKSIKEWREWLKKKYESDERVYLVKYKKHTGKPSLTSKEALIEAIRFGWVDTTINSIDEDKYAQCFMKRKKTSNWSKNTLGYARELIKQGVMTSSGLEAYNRGKKRFARSRI